MQRTITPSSETATGTASRHARRPACRPPLASAVAYRRHRGRGCRPARWGRPMKRPALPRLMRELIAAHQPRAPSRSQRSAGRLRPAPPGGPLLGGRFRRRSTRTTTRRRPAGDAALIVPHFEETRLLDLVACGLPTRTCRTREGICTALGTRPYRARQGNRERPLRLFADPIDWLRNGRRGLR